MKSCKLFLMMLGVVSLISSCSVEKRHYMAGYHVEWNHKKSLPEKQVAMKESRDEQMVQTIADESTDESQLAASVKDNASINIPKKQVLLARKNVQQKITLKDKVLQPLVKLQQTKIIHSASGSGGDGHGAAVSSLVLGIIGMFLSIIPIIGIICGILSVVLSLVALNKIGDGKGKGLAIAGLVCGIIAIVFSVLFWTAWATFFSFL